MYNLRDVNDNREHYLRPNGRVPGWQILTNGALDGRQLMAMSKIPHDSTVLDLGCADGSFLIIGHLLGRIASGYGVDLWANGITWGQEFTRQHKIPVELTIGMIGDYNGPSVDVAFIGEVLEHMPDPVDGLRTAARHAPRVVITVPVGRPPYTPAELDKLLREPDEHIQIYDSDGQRLESDCRDAGLTIVEKAIQGDQWVNLIAVAIRA